MAGGDANLYNLPYPNGPYMLTFGPFDLSASKTDHIVDSMTMPFRGRAVKAEFTASILTETTAITINLEDDSTSAKVVISNAGVLRLWLEPVPSKPSQ
jgi:hypothetical protein